MILLDAGPLVAASNARDAHHDAAREALATPTEPLLLSPFIVAEVAYLLGTQAHPKVEASFLQSLMNWPFKVVDLVGSDYVRIAELVVQYADLPLGSGDASIVAVAERVGVSKVMTLDYRHFSIVRPSHIDAFELLVPGQ